VKRLVMLLVLAATAAAAAAAAPGAERAVVRAVQKPDPQRRLALVIGNAAYPKQPLANPRLDAEAVASSLRGLGFEVVPLTDAGRIAMVRALEQFKQKLGGAGVGLVYFAGHGIQMDGQNYLIPVDADMENEDQIKFNTIRLDDVLDTLAQAGPPLKIVVLDACRNNPFQRTRGGSSGLAAVTQAPEGMLIAYSTAPGRVAQDGAPGENGLYTKHLLAALQEPGRSIEQVFKLTRARVAEASRGRQIPWESTSLTGELVLKPGPARSEKQEVAAFRSLKTGSRPARLDAGAAFRDCERCPEMVVLPAGAFRMGSPEAEPGRQPNEGPAREVRLPRAFAVGRFEVTFAEWEACLLDGGCDRWPDDRGFGRGRRPVIDVSWEDATRYAAWLSKHTGRTYRLLSEAEWEYAARAGSDAARPWGAGLGERQARCADCGRAEAAGTAPAGSYPRNKWDLADMLGNVWEWTADCYNPTLAGADAAARDTGDCAQRMLRGGSWLTAAKGVRAAARSQYPATRRAANVGFRVATSIDQGKGE